MFRPFDPKAPPPPPGTWNPPPKQPPPPPGGWNPPPPPSPPPPQANAPRTPFELRRPPDEILPPELQGRYAPTETPNRVTIPARALFEYTCNRPTVLVSMSVPTGLVYYQPKQRPTWSVALPPTIATISAHPLLSVGPGNVYLYAPGDWFLWLDAAAALEYLAITCEDPAIAVRYMTEPGWHSATTPATGVLSGASGTTASIPANRNRKALIVQNTTGGGSNLRVGFGVAPDVSAAPPAGSGIVLGNLQSLTLAGDLCYKGEVFVGAPAVAWAANWVEAE